jgi:hypothetical protein
VENAAGMPSKGKEIDRYFDISAKIFENRDMIYTLWEMVETLKADVKALTKEHTTNSRRRGKRGGRRTARKSRK